MITAQATQYATHTHLEIIYPDKAVTDPKDVANLEDAQILVNFLNRQYIVTKLRSWLRQRQFALHGSGKAEQQVSAAKLLVILGTYDRRQLPGLCEFVTSHTQMFKSLAPGELSPQYNHYNKIIAPILRFCSEMADGLSILKSDK